MEAASRTRSPESTIASKPPRSAYAKRLDEFPDVALADEAAFTRRGQWADYFRQRIGPAFDGRLIFEVGCFDAAFLARIAAKFPATGFVGLDWKCKAVFDGARRVTQANLRNVALIRGRAQDVDRIFGEREVDELWVFHPDPCDTPVELRNRLFAEPFLSAAHGVLRDERATITLKTDHPGYYQWALAVLGLPQPSWFEAARLGTTKDHPRIRSEDLVGPAELPAASEAVVRRFAVTANSANYWHDAIALARTGGRCFAGESTLFEGRFVAKRLPIYYLELARRDRSATCL